MTTETFNLRELTWEIRRASGVVDPHELWPLVLDKIASADYAAALTQTLPEFVRRVIRNPSDPDLISESESDDGDSPDPTSERAASTRPSSGSGESWRRRAARVLRLRARGEHDGMTWRELDACDSAFLRAAAAYKRGKADQTYAVAERYEHVAAEMEIRKITAVRDLPDDMVLAWFGCVR